MTRTEVVRNQRARTPRPRARRRAVSVVATILAMAVGIAGAPPALAAGPVVVQVEALSVHRLRVTFDTNPTNAALTPSNYTITGPTGTLPVPAISSLGGKQALFSTGSQQAVTYEMKGPDRNAAAVPFTGSTDAEPTLGEAVSLSATSVALTFSEAMGAGANEATRYTITDPNAPATGSGGGGNGGGGGLLGGLGNLARGVLDSVTGSTKKSNTSSTAVTVTAAAIDTQNPARVVLTTSNQSAVEYTVSVGDIRGQSGEYIDIDADTARFGGIPVVDKTPPKLLSAVPQNERTLLLSFDKPLAYSAADPAKYRSSPNLFVDSAALQSGLRQVLLGTGVQFAVSYTVTADVVDAGGTAISSSSKTATFTGSRAISGDRPKVVSATSTGNAKVVVQFSKPMADSAADPARYRVDQQAPAVGSVAVLSARFIDSERIAVELTTESQAEVNYRASVADVTDLLGNPMADRGTGPGGIVVDPTSANFLGTGPTGAQIVDTDGDGLFDHEEATSREVTIRLATGGIRTFQVTSDRLRTDTDSDGLDDFVEKGLGTDPRDTDTDDDGLSDADEFNEIFSDPTIQDTDGDGLTDGLEVTFYNSSALLADTDGDQLSDGLETSLGKRNVRAADLPKPSLSVGTMTLALDVRFTQTTSTESKEIEARSAKSTLMQSNKQEYANVTSRTLEAGGKLATEAGYSVEVTASKDPSLKQTFSAKASQEESFNSTYLTSFTETSSAETAETYEQSLDTTAEVAEGATVAREVRAASISTVVTLRSVGDIAFTLRNVQLTALVPHPEDPSRLTPVATLVPDAEPSSGYSLGPLTPDRGPILFSNREVFPSLVEDLMASPRGLVFRFSNYDVTDELGRNFAFTSQEINDRTAAVIVDYGGADLDGDGVGELSEIHRVATGIGSRFDSNGDGVVDNQDRKRVFDAEGRQVGITLREALAALNLTAYDERVAPTSSLGASAIKTSYSTMKYDDGSEVIFRIRDIAVSLGQPKRWEILTAEGVDRTLSLDRYVLMAGDRVHLSFLQDADRDRLPASIEALNRCSDLKRDTDGDNLDDRFETLGGWTVDVDGLTRPGRVFSSCADGDTDDDGLTDDIEAPGIRELEDGLIRFDAGHRPRRNSSSTSPLQRTFDDPITDPSSRDTDGDGIADKTELNGYSFKLRSGATVTRTSSPEMSDTDNDGASDGLEVALGGDPRNGSDADSFTDSDRDGLVDAQEDDGWYVTKQGVSNEAGLCESRCLPPAAEPAMLWKSSKFHADTDGDGLSDGEEYRLRTNPRSRDTDEDDLTDFQEVRGFNHPTLGTMTTNPLDADSDDDKLSDGFETGVVGNPWIVRLPGKAPYQVWSNPNSADADLDRLVDGDEHRHDTDPGNHNTDGDNKFDYEEVKEGKRRPTVPDRFVTARLSRLYIKNDAGDGPGEFWFAFGMDSTRTSAVDLAFSSRTDPNEGGFDLPPCAPALGLTPTNIPCRDINGAIRLRDGSSLSMPSTTVVFGSVSTTDDLYEQILLFGRIQEREGPEEIDCDVQFPDFGSNPDAVDTGLVRGRDLRIGTNAFNITRTATCAGDHPLEFTLYATYTAD